jgi:hypothetical protein
MATRAKTLNREAQIMGNDKRSREDRAEATRSKGRTAARGVQNRATGDGNTRANNILKQTEENARHIEEEGDN